MKGKRCALLVFLHFLHFLWLEEGNLKSGRCEDLKFVLHDGHSGSRAVSRLRQYSQMVTPSHVVATCLWHEEDPGTWVFLRQVSVE